MLDAIFRRLTVTHATLPLALFALPGCFNLLPQKPIESLGGEYSSPLDDDLRQAVATANKEFPHMGDHFNVHVRWAGVLQGANYTVVRDPATGLPQRQIAQVIYAFDGPGGKCFLSRFLNQTSYPNVYLARENLGGGRYGAPHINGSPPIDGQGKPTGSEIRCAAVDDVKGGVHADGAKATAQQDVPSTDSTSPTSAAATPNAASPGDATKPAFDADKALADLTPAVSTSCRTYTRTACLNPKLPAGSDRAYFCKSLVQRANASAKQPNAEKVCKGMLKNATTTTTTSTTGK
jgi:hypothetical protein